MGVTVGALHPVDIVLTAGGAEGSIHLFDVEPAVRHLRMAVCAGGARLLTVLGVARQATDAFVYAHASPVIAASYLTRSDRGMALIAERLSLVGTHSYGTRALEHRRYGQVGDRHVLLAPPIEKGE